MDFPGFHVDPYALTALITLINTGLLIWQARTVSATHAAVNGMQQQKVADAHAAGLAEGVDLPQKPG